MRDIGLQAVHVVREQTDNKANVVPCDRLPGSSPHLIWTLNCLLPKKEPGFWLIAVLISLLLHGSLIWWRPGTPVVPKLKQEKPQMTRIRFLPAALPRPLPPTLPKAPSAPARQLEQEEALFQPVARQAPPAESIPASQAAAASPSETVPQRTLPEPPLTAPAQKTVESIRQHYLARLAAHL